MGIFEELEEKLFEDSLIDSKLLNRFKFESLSNLYRDLKKEKKCIFPKCKNTSIKKSHAIQKSGSLDEISENSHLMTPYFDSFAKELTFIMKSIGIGEATTFPGFCMTHERYFSSFEEKKNIDTIQEAKLQAYRSLCRELVINNIELENCKKKILKYKSERNRQAKLFLQTKIKQDINNVEVKYEDFRLNSANLAKSKLMLKIDFLESLHGRFLKYLKHNENDEMFFETFKIDINFPVALSGLGYINFKEGDSFREVKCLLNIIPFKSSTVLILAGELKDEDILMQQFKFIIQHPFLILNFIESFMMHGTDQWYIKPSIWEGMDKKKQDYLLRYLFVTEKSFVEQLEFSIFDDIRREFLETLPVNQEFHNNELQKLNFEFNPLNETLLDSLQKRYDDFYSKKA